MPWNCLCSAKEKRKVEISGPILNPDDSQSLQLLPLKQQKAQVVASNRRDSLENQTNGLRNKNNNSGIDGINQTRNASSKGKRGAGKNQNTEPATGENLPNDGDDIALGKVCKKGKSAKKLVNVKFSFDKATDKVHDFAPTVVAPPPAQNDGAAPPHQLAATPTTLTDTINGLASKVDVEQLKRENAGNYDEIPLVNVTADVVDGADSARRERSTTPADAHYSLSGSKSNESIPFIDDDGAFSKSSSPQRQQNANASDHDVRFITLHPRNVGSPRTAAKQQQNHADYLRLVTQPNLTVVQQEPDPVILPPPFEHNFQLWQFPKGKLCQLCHDPMAGSFIAFKCRSCDLMCHEWCAASMPNVRYHDTSLVIFRKWIESHEKYAFPTLHRFAYGRKRQEESQEFDRHNLTDSECTYSNGGDKQQTEQIDINDRKIRRRTRSLERRKQPPQPPQPPQKQKRPDSLALDQAKPQIPTATDDQNNNRNETTLMLTEDNVKLHILEPNRNTIGSDRSSTTSQLGLPVGPTHVVVDVHHRPNSEVLVINEISDPNHAKENVPENLKKQITNTNYNNTNNNDRNSIVSDISDRTLGSQTGGTSVYSTAYSHSNAPSIDDSDTDTIDYARVDLRRMINSRIDLQRQLSAKNHDEHSGEQQQLTIPRSQSFPVQTKSLQQSSGSLRLHYVTQRILASVLPRREPENSRGSGGGGGEFEDKHEKEIISMLEQKHGKNYRVFDLESCISVVTLERICELCKHIDSWLGGGQEKVVVLQDRDDRQRLGVAIAAYLEYLDICSSNYTIRNGTSNEDLRVQNTIAQNWLDLDVFSMKKFLEDFIGPLRIPSHNRYLRYFSGLLSGKIRMNSSPLHLKHVSLESPPTWMQYSRLSAQNSEWVTFIKIYEGLRCVYTSDIHIIPITTRQFLYQIGCLRLRGDILIRCYHITSPENRYNQETRELLFSVQFHTCAITSKDVTFGRNDLDLACDDPRFPSDHKVLLHFGSGGPNENGLVFQSPLIRTEPPNELAKYDSIENLDMNSSYHTQGPLDGSLYATILKSPKSPQIPYPFPNISPRTSSSQHRESLGQNLISPPPQFSNKQQQQQQQQQQQYELVERRPSSVTPSRDSIARREIQVTSSTKLHQNSHNSSSHSNPKSDYSYVETRPSTSQSNYRDSNKYSASGNPNHQHYSPETRQITIVETYNSTTDGHQNYQNGGRESVRSPLTLSMDSGISSSGVLNRPQQGSSVSPSSFPSQASPQEDRHRELDDILSDMLMTVQDIPDYSKASKQNQPHHIVRSQSVIPTSGSYVLPGSYNGHQHQQQPVQYNTVKRSQSYVVQESAVQNPYLPKDRQDFYDTSSTTTTLTPPASESGRDTPTGVYSNTGSLSNISTLQHRQTLQREKRDAFLTSGNQQHQQQLIMDLQHQSSAYPQTVRTETVIVSASEDDEIPYHAREHSQPFSYGSVPANSTLRSEEGPVDPEMIKMQSGLSSPSLVRKTLGRSPSPSTLRKTAPRTDFEEMLRDRREKVKNEKYSISDRTTINNPSDFIDRRTYGSENKWVGSSAVNQPLHSQSNGYHQYNEPLRRSNTMDGGFARSNSTDGISSQTWLQLQQQKLRAKKDQQQRDDRRYFEEVIHTEIRNRPLRSRATNGQRFDGYSSDTAAFTDEVDFRRPLHVQTPFTPNRSSDRNYHTLTSTTTTVSQKERPFVAIKRAHELAKQPTTGSPPISPLSVLNASPNGHITQAQQQNGLLSMADSPRNGHVRLESDNATNFQPQNSSIACTNVNYNHINHNKLTTSTDHTHETINANHHQQINTNINNNNNNKSLNGVNNSEKDDGKLSACGQLALDKLIASLAVEANFTDQRLAEVNGNVGYNHIEDGIELRKKPSRTYTSAAQNNNNSIKSSHHGNPETIYKNSHSSGNKVNPELSDVIANLTEFTRYEELRQLGLHNNGYSDSLSNNSNSISSTNGISRRLISESENSSSVSPSLSERSNAVSWLDHQVREESFSSYRSETDPELSIAGSPRPETPAFPVTPRTPYGLTTNGNVSPALPPKSPTSLRKDLFSGNQKGHLHEVVNQNDTISCYASRRNSNTSNANSEPQEVAPHLVKFVRDSSKYWYKPNISREEAVDLLRNAEPGTFVVRDSTTFKNAFGLVVRVAHPPVGVQLKGPPGDELVRHFLVEPTSRGVRLKGCANEPVFSSLSALVYQHSIMPLALPCRLIIPDRDIQALEIHSPAQRQLLAQGAACNVLYLYTCETESLTGEEAVRRAVSQLFSYKPLPTPTEVHFKVAHQGITLTDNTRQKFFRKHYAASHVSFCGLDPEKRTWSIPAPGSDIPVNNKTIFAFVARRSASSKDNQCHLFCDLQSNQPALAVVSFANKVLPTEKLVNQHI